jgi:membrane protease YdiL (CAAX protease family)
MNLKPKHIFYLSIVEISISIFIYYIIVWKLSYYLNNPTLWQIILFLFFSIIAMYYLFFVSPKFYNETNEDRGIGKAKNLFIPIDNFFSSAPSYMIALIIFLFALIIMTFIKFNSQNFEINYFSIIIKFIFYLFSATAQALIFFSFLLLRIQYVINYFNHLHNKYIILILFSIMFSLFHYPNYIICILTFFFAFILGFIFIEKRNIAWVILIHAILGTFLHRIYQTDMKIGVFYGTNYSFFRKIIPQIDSLIGNLW